MARYINADALINKLDERCDAICQWTKKEREVMCGACPMATAFDAVEDFPSADVVEVVRCKDCEFWQTDWIPNRGGDKGCHYCAMIDGSTEPLMYCAYGERKEL